MARTFRDDRRCARTENKNGPRKRGNRALRKRRPPNQLKTRRLSMKTGLHARLVRLSPGQQAMRAMLSSIVVSVLACISLGIGDELGHRSGRPRRMDGHEV